MPAVVGPEAAIVQPLGAVAETVTSCSEWRPSFSSAVVTVFDAPGSTISSDVPSAADSVVAGATEPKPSSRESTEQGGAVRGHLAADRARGLGART